MIVPDFAHHFCSSMLFCDIYKSCSVTFISRHRHTHSCPVVHPFHKNILRNNLHNSHSNVIAVEDILDTDDVFCTLAGHAGCYCIPKSLAMNKQGTTTCMAFGLCADIEEHTQKCQLRGVEPVAVLAGTVAETAHERHEATVLAGLS